MPGAIRNALTVDVEDWYHVAAFAPYIERSRWDGLQSRVKANTESLLDLFDQHDVRATFFVLGWVAEREPDVIKRIHARGHEIACHGYSHELVYRQTPEVFREETHRAKAILEDITGAPVLGYRASTYSITRQSLWALDILLEAGFVYDSSIFPVRHPQYGIPGASRSPGRVSTPLGKEIVEFPLSTLPLGKWAIPVAGGGYFRLFPYAWSRAALARINRHEQMPFIFYLHPWEIDEGQPRVDASVVARFRHYNNIARCAARLKSLLKDFSFTTAHDVLTSAGLLQAGKPHAPRGAEDMRGAVLGGAVS
jgi:polysaccharide deacetylase family protein (PEP-CTERM system associated)